MKLVVLVPSKEYQSSAGARIRYGRVAEGLGSRDVFLRLELINDFDPLTADYDALVVSKCHDARALLAAAIASSRGKLVGVDLFDDYFSQLEDSRLIRYRDWLAALLHDCDFSLCSTAALAKVVNSYRPGLPVHVVNDPAPEQSPAAVLEAADRKALEACRANSIEVAWFGVGDNPYFPVGLADLFAHSSALSEIARSGVSVDLTVLTNRRALGPDGLELLAQLPVPYRLMEWSQADEQRILERAHLAFLPVSSAPFSAAKSLNRALTSLAHGCQALSVGFPLYAALAPLIYRDVPNYLADLSAGRMRLSAANADVYLEKLHALGDADNEAARLGEFLSRLSPSPNAEHPKICVVHGLATRVEVHHLTQKLGALSVASPFCSAKLDFDIKFAGLPPAMSMRCADDVKFVGRLSAASLNPSSWLDDLLPKRNASKGNVQVPLEVAAYAHTMREIRTRLTELLGPVRVIVSETARVPVSADLSS